MNTEKILNIWGKGQILALSALDGQTSSRHGLVFTTAEKEFALLPRWPFNSGKIAFAGAPENLFLASDMLESSGVKAAFVDAFHFLIEAENVSLDLPPELAVLHEGKRILIGTKANFNPELIRIDLDSILAERKRYFEELPDFSSTDTARRTLAKACSQLKGQICSPEGFNALHRWTTPDRWPHRHAWLWDSVFHAIGLRHINPALALETLEAVLDRQQPDGLIPHMMGVDCVSHFTQPPVLAFGISEVLKMKNDEAFLRRAFPKLERYVEWIMRHRDSDGLGLVEWDIEGNPLCRSGESGMDNSPRFDSATQLDAPDFNAFLSLECECLARFAESLNLPEKAAFWQAHHNRLNSLMNELLWDEESRIYMDRDVTTGKRTGISASSGFLPLICGAPSQEQAEKLLANLCDPATFATPFRIPSISRKNTEAYAKDMWRGPVWININWLIAFGLERYGMTADTRRILSETVAEEEKFYLKYGTFFEFYDDRNECDPPLLCRKGKCAPEISPYNQVFHDYGWSATLYIDMLAKLKS